MQDASPPHSRSANREQIGVAVVGARGRMGSAIVRAVQASADLRLAAAVGRPDQSPETRAGEQADALANALDLAQVIIDVSAPAAAAALSVRCAERGGPALVLGVTGLDEAQEAKVRDAAGAVAIVKSGNFSLGVNLLAALVRQAARMLDPGYDIEVFDAHHRRKLDAPSGTALMLGKAAAEGRGWDPGTALAGAGESRCGLRTDDRVGFSVIRAGGIVGDHSVSFVAEDEIVTLSHSARDRSLFARGAVQAARWVAERPAGLYDMTDVLGLPRDD